MTDPDYNDLQPIVLSLYDRDFQPLDWITAPARVEVAIDWRGDVPGWLTFTLDADDDAIDLLTDPAVGARLVAQYRYDPVNPRLLRHLLNGPITERAGNSTQGSATRTFDVIDDVDLLSAIEGWPNPAGTIEQQGDDGMYWTMTGPAESVVKALVAANAPRFGLPLTIAPDQGRGDTITVKIRMHPLADRLFPAVNDAGIGVQVLQVGAGLVLDCYEPTQPLQTLTQASGVVVDGSFRMTPPTATRAVVMGKGEGIARIMALVVDTALEAQWGWRFKRTVTVDARNNSDIDAAALEAGDPTALAAYRASLQADGWEKLAEHRPVASVAAELAETDEFRVGVAAWLGDPVEVVLNDAPAIADRLTTIKLVLDADEGLTVTPSVGEVADDPDAAVIDTVADILRAQRDANVGR